MSQSNFPALTLADWQPTRDTLQTYSKVLGKIRRALTPPQKHWWHISLRMVPTGLTTTPIPISDADDDATFEMILDLQQAQLLITTNRGENWQTPLTGQSAQEFCDTVLAALAKLGVAVEIDRSLFADETPLSLDPAAAQKCGQALAAIDGVFKQFKAELPGETSPVQLWPHHFDLAVLWFSGRKVPGIDPADEENADEQMNFGFSTGDEGMPAPYFYATAYPWPADITAAPLPAGATWHTQSWKGGLLMYESLVGVEEPEQKLLAFLRAVQQAGSALMK
ncbi:MAG: hypothetical protein DPW09_31635 [Anaerolineae bacterium]|nr:hypothetical protein [Anaerolineales bacterium]MCQ3978001.1 hypothetical protein [Anaerolineae bacterium]